MSSSEIIKSYSPTYYFKADNSTVNSDGSVNPTVTTGGSNTFFTSGGAWDTGYINSGSSTGTGYGFQHSDTTAIFNDKSFTISGWFNVGSLPTGTINWIFHTGTSASGIALENGNIYAGLNGTNFTAAATYTTNKWNHFAWVVNGSTQQLFLNGVSTGTATATPTTISMDSSVKYWFRETTSGTPRKGVTGKFDELAVFDSALSSTDIYILAKSIPPVPMTASSTMPNPGVYTNNLVAHALSDKAVYLFKLDATVNEVAGVAITGGRSFSTITNSATYQAGQSVTGGAGSWFVTNSNTVGNEITLLESSSPVITYEKGLTVEMAFYYPAYVAPDAAGQFIMTKNWSGGGVDMKFQTSGGVNYVEAGFSGGGYHTHSQGLVPGRWYHVVARWDATDDYTYLTLNGSTEISANKNTGSGNNFGTSTSMNIGGDCGLYFDYIAFYSEQYNSTKLSGTQLTDHYNSFEANRYAFQSKSVAATPMLASAFSPTGGGYPASSMTAFGEMGNNLVTTIRNKTVSATALTASANAENPVISAGTTHGALHMEASADMGQDSIPFILGIAIANPMIASALAVNPSVSTQKGALIKPQALTASTVIITPPAYVLLTDDIWYSKLYLQHSVVHGEEGYTPGSSSAYAFLKLFNDVTSNLSGAVTSKLTNNLPWSIVSDNPDSTATTVTYATASNEFLTATPSPLLEVGTFDEHERKAVRFRNIQFKVNEDIYKADGPYSLEFTFKTTKANQVIAQGLQRSFTGSQSATSSIGLIDGKLFASRATQGIGVPRVFAHPDNQNLVKMDTAYGNKAIADGQWHHLIIQYGFDGRVQFWIDGQLDIQFFSDSIYGKGAKLRPYIFGSNHTNPRWQSDFETSAWSYDAAFFVDSADITQHYTASIKYEPIKAPVATAVATMPEPAVAGNRPRALMLYFWPTSAGQVSNLSYAGFTSNESPSELETLDYYTAPPQNYEGWDVFPVDVTGRFVSDLVKPEAYGVENIQLTTLGGTVDIFATPQQTVKVNKRKTFRDKLTDAPRYLDLINDIDLTKFDMIMFKNYPDDSAEKDAFSTNEVVDAYFNLRETIIFEQFVKSLRAAVDTGLSLVVTNPQLAIDLKIVDRVETVPDMDDLSGYESDPFAPTQVPQASTLPVTAGYPDTNHWWDTWKNNRARVVNTQPGLTDNGGLVRTQIAFWNNDDNGVRYGGPDRPFNRYEHKDALAVGDEFVLSSEPVRTTRKNFQASPISAVKTGKVITAFANTVRRGLTEITNPYKDYAISIAVNPGDVVDGRQVGGKIFVNFTENINNSIETGDVDLTSDYWINYAYANGAITADQRDAYLAADWNTDTTPYWSSDGMNILLQASQLQDENLQKKGNQTAARKVRSVNKSGGISFKSVASGSQYFALTFSWLYPRATFEVPSIITNGFRWLSNREVIDGTLVRPQAFTATATMPNAIAIPDKDFSYNVQAMVASAVIVETSKNSGNVNKPALPATATATIVKPGSTIAAQPMTANAILRLDSRAKVASEDQVTLYLMHVDPILYIREDVIK